MKVEISLETYNKLKIKEEVLTQINSVKIPTSADYTSISNYYRNYINILDSFDDIDTPEYDDIEDINITLTKKLYDYYLMLQSCFSQMENLTRPSLDSTVSLANYCNTIFIYLSTFQKIVKNKDSDMEEFNTLVKLTKENRELKKKNVEMENILNAHIDDDGDPYFEF